ncbi:MAG: hypothetical protein AB1515_10995, partial [Nitrospirota bacterium]
MIGYAWFFILAGCAPTLDPFAGPSPFQLGQERSLGPDAAAQAEAPDAAWSGEDFLVVWSGRRVGGLDLFAARVSPQGDPIGGIPSISSAPGDQTRPSVVWCGDQFFVAWEDRRSGVNKIFGTWIGARGEVLQPNGFAIAGSRYPQSAPRAVWTGRDVFVVWTEEIGGGSGLDLYGTAVQPGVTATALQGTPIVAAPADQFEPALAWGPAGGLIAWIDHRSGAGEEGTDVHAALLNGDGQRRSPADLTVPAAGAQRLPTAAWDGRQFVLFWTDRREGGDLIYGGRITDKGRLLDPSGIPITRGPTRAGPPLLVGLLPSGLAALWTEIGQDQHLVVGRIWDEGFEP